MEIPARSVLMIYIRCPYFILLRSVEYILFLAHLSPMALGTKNNDFDRYLRFPQFCVLSNNPLPPTTQVGPLRECWPLLTLSNPCFSERTPPLFPFPSFPLQ